MWIIRADPKSTCMQFGWNSGIFVLQQCVKTSSQRLHPRYHEHIWCTSKQAMGRRTHDPSSSRVTQHPAGEGLWAGGRKLNLVLLWALMAGHMPFLSHQAGRNANRGSRRWRGALPHGWEWGGLAPGVFVHCTCKTESFALCFSP